MERKKASSRSNNTLEYIEKINKPEEEPVGVVIWLHGLGANYNDFIPLVKEFKLNHCIKFIFPNAPLRPITVNHGHVMRGWYDIRDMNNLDDTVDKDGIHQSIAAVESLIADLISSGYKSSHIIVAGFSQGGVIAYQLAVQTKYRLGGVLVLSAYLADKDMIDNDSVNKKTSILACHGKQDMVIPHEVGLEAYNELRTRGFNVSWMSYQMEHGLCLQQVHDISLWLQERFML